MTQPTRTLTPDEIEDYRRDGVVCLRGALGDDWIAVVKDAVDDAERRYGNSLDSTTYPVVWPRS